LVPERTSAEFRELPVHESEEALRREVFAGDGQLLQVIKVADGLSRMGRANLLGPCFLFSEPEAVSVCVGADELVDEQLVQSDSSMRLHGGA
jgi:hypothetical protein